MTETPEFRKDVLCLCDGMTPGLFFKNLLPMDVPMDAHPQIRELMEVRIEMDKYDRNGK